jgi:ATP-dependent Lhr-like helicase
LARIEKGDIELVARDTREPSPFSHSILNANPYSFLDDAPLEERRARAVNVRRLLSLDDMDDLSRLDADAIERVQKEARPLVRDAEELHDTLMTLGAWPAAETPSWTGLFETLVSNDRATRAQVSNGVELWVAAERWSLVQAVFPDAVATPPLSLPPELLKQHDATSATLALVRGRIEISGPITAQRIADDLGLSVLAVDSALATLEAEGFVLQGRYTSTSSSAPVEWCERRLLARIHRLTLDTARKRIQPVTPQAYWLFLAEHHYLFPGRHRGESLGLREALGQLQGFEMPAGAWESDVLSNRVEKYDPLWLDALSFSGELAWGRLRSPQKSDDADGAWSGGLTRVVPVSLIFREDMPWLLPSRTPEEEQALVARAKPEARAVYQALEKGGALFLHDLAQAAGLLPSRVEETLGELAALGLISADGFSALRALTPIHRWQKSRRTRSNAARAVYGRGGRWTLFPGRFAPSASEERLQQWAMQLLRRYGVVFRDLLARETVAPPWWELVPIYRRMEARGEIRGGRFVSGVAGEQYAAPEAIEALRRPRDAENSWLLVSAVDPLNLTGTVLPGPRVPAFRGNRLLFHNGQLVATLEGGEVKMVVDEKNDVVDKITRVLRLTQNAGLRESLLGELAQ